MTTMFIKMKKLLHTSRIQLCLKCYQLNAKSFSQISHNVKSILKHSSQKINFEKKSLPGNGIISSSRFITAKVNTNVVKDVVVYKQSKSRHTNIIVLFGLSQSVFWYYMGYVVVTELRDVPVEEETEDKKLDFFTRHNFGENKWKYSMGFACAAIGTLAFAFSFLYNTRIITSVRLDKAGKTLSLLVAEDKFWRKQIVVPLQNVSAYYSRSEMKSFFPVFIKGQRLFYIIDMEGDINNEVLFDVTVGTKRNFGPDK